jgi:2-polyprenyl-3-methyl-5-hydroxy-6-metoxy-1,4-benzoquinol methylase
LPLGGKSSEYFEHPRADLVAMLPSRLRRVLDVGCGAGNVGRTLRAAGAAELVGIEMDRDAARRAREVFDVVHEGDAQRVVTGLSAEEPFDVICCYDILEHLYDPETVLRQLLAIAAPGGVLHISIPNARHFSLILDLVVRGTFGYQPVGHRDATHLRWFTREDIVRLVEDCGWTVTEVTTHLFRPGRALITKLSRGYAREFFAVQWYVRCQA